MHDTACAGVGILISMEHIPPGIYSHYKDPAKRYEIVGTGLDTATDGLVVVYRPLYETDYELFTRPIIQFFQEVDDPKYSYQGPRFTLVEEK